MAKFRSPKPPERQAREVTGALVNLGALRRNPARPASLRTVQNYRDCLLQVARRIAADGRELRDLAPDTAEAYLRGRAGELGQKALDMHRRALQAMLVHVSRRLPQGRRLDVVRSERPDRHRSRAYTPAQVCRVAAAQTPRNALATLIAHAAGLRAHELLTLARPAEQPPDPRPARESKFAGRPGVDYTVVGKGGLVRTVRLPEHLAIRLEERRREAPATVTDRGIRYRSRYDVAGGRAWGASFSAASVRSLGWSRGAHGLRHSYAQERTAETRRLLSHHAARETVSQELGHFRASVTDAYLK